LQVAPSAAGSLQVIVENAATLKPIPSASVDAVESTGAGGDLGTETTDPTGTVNYTNVPSGTYTVTAMDPPAFGSNFVITKVLSGQQDVITILLSAPTGTISGKVEVTGGAAFLGGATVTATLTGASTAAGTTTSSVTDGTYSITGLAAGTYNVSAIAPDFSPATVQDITVTSGDTTSNVTLILSTAPVLTGTVTDVTTGDPISGATVAFTPAVGAETSVTTNGSGLYTINGVIGGVYTLTVSATGYNSSPATQVTVAPTLTTTQNFALSKAVTSGYGTGLAFFSLPYDYSSTGFTLAQILEYPSGDAAPDLALWDPTNLEYQETYAPTTPVAGVEYGSPTTILPGIGYWVRFPSGYTGVVQQGAVLTTSLTINLQTGWNQIGDPYDANMPVSTLSFTESGGSPPIPFGTAVTDGLVSSTLWSFNTGYVQGGGTSAYTAVTSSSNLVPFSGYWIQVFAPVQLTFTLP
jgi:hypothetical protein